MSLKLSKEEQVKIMEGQLNSFDSLVEKMQYMNKYFDKDPEFTKEARDLVRSNISKNIKYFHDDECCPRCLVGRKNCLC